MWRGAEEDDEEVGVVLAEALQLGSPNQLQQLATLAWREAVAYMRALAKRMRRGGRVSKGRRTSGAVRSR